MFQEQLKIWLFSISPVEIKSAVGDSDVDAPFIRGARDSLPILPFSAVKGAFRMLASTTIATALFGGASAYGVGSALSFSDGRLVCFPVNSPDGPAWITSGSNASTLGQDECGVKPAWAPAGSGPLLLADEPFARRPNVAMAAIYRAEKGLASFVRGDLSRRLAVLAPEDFVRITGIAGQRLFRIQRSAETGLTEREALWQEEVMPEGCLFEVTVHCTDSKAKKELQSIVSRGEVQIGGGVGFGRGWFEIREV